MISKIIYKFLQFYILCMNIGHIYIYIERERERERDDLYSYTIFNFMSVGWDVKWCPVSRITTPLARKRPFH